MQDKKLQGVSIYCYTGNIRAALVKAGFDAYTEKNILAETRIFALAMSCCWRATM